MKTSRKILCGIGVAAVIGVGGALFHGCSDTRDQGEGEGWHIVVKRYHDNLRDQKAGIIYEALRRVPQLDPGRIKKTTSADSVVVTYGRYASLQDPKAKTDLQFIKSLMIPNEGYPFLDAHLEPISEPDPPVDPAWLLANAKGYWTLQIGQFDGRKRKQAAVDLTRELRREGKPAYVHHGPVKSMVTLGAFPYKAVTAPGPNAISQQPRAADPKLRKLKGEYPYLIINSGYGKIRNLQGVPGEQMMTSTIIKIPRPGASLW